MKTDNLRKPASRTLANRKEQILQAAENLLQKQGLNGMTTRAIAAAVPCSEGAIYVHFQDRLELVLAVLESSLWDMLVPLQALQKQVGAQTPTHNLVGAMQGLLVFHQRAMPLLCSLFADAGLRDRFSQSLQQRQQGPQRGIATLADYIRQEQQGGRIASSVDANSAATMLMSSSFFHIFSGQLVRSSVSLDLPQLVRSVIRDDS